MSGWAHQLRRRRNHRDFGGRWQDRIPLRFLDPRHGETLRAYCKRIGYYRDDLAKLCKRSGGDRQWQDIDDGCAWFKEAGLLAPRPPFHINCRCGRNLVVRPFDFARTHKVQQ